MVICFGKTDKQTVVTPKNYKNSMAQKCVDVILHHGQVDEVQQRDQMKS